LQTNLPTCTKEQILRWRALSGHPERMRRIPPCDPGFVPPEAISDAFVAAYVNVPDKRVVLQRDRLPGGIDVVGYIGGLAWLLFLAPGVVILVGGLVAGGTGGGFLRWTGISISVGGLIPLFATTLVRSAVLTGAMTAPADWDFSRSYPFWTSRASHLLARQIAELTEMVVNKLFAPVSTIAIVTCVLGLALLLLSFLAVRK